MSKLELFYPSKPYKLGQSFGANEACVENKPDLPITKRKVIGKVGGTCPLGFVELYPLLGMSGHTGEDLYAPDGWILRSPFDGIVKEIQTEPERGLGVGIITHNKRILGSFGEHYVKARQWHLKTILVSMNQQVKVGDPIGLADNTGLSAGSHNHFEIKPIEYDLNGNHYNVFQENFYFGAINPAPYWSGMYAEDYADIRAKLQVINIQFQQLLNNWLKRS